MDFELAHALSQAAVFADRKTAAHNWRVTMYAQALGEAVEFDDDERRRFMMAAVLHDLGKIDIPREILTKPGPLTDLEYDIVKRHTIYGWERLAGMTDDPIILGVVRNHHERMDGTGYPDRLVGDAIPFAARLFAVIDAFDAMTSLRSYRATTGAGAARAALVDLSLHADEDADHWYDRRAVDAFTRLHKSGGLDQILAHLNDEDALAEIAPADEAVVREARRLISESTPAGLPDPSGLFDHPGPR